MYGNRCFQGGGKCHTSDLMQMLSMAGCVGQSWALRPKSGWKVVGYGGRFIHYLHYSSKCSLQLTEAYLLLVSSEKLAFPRSRSWSVGVQPKFLLLPC